MTDKVILPFTRRFELSIVGDVQHQGAGNEEIRTSAAAGLRAGITVLPYLVVESTAATFSRWGRDEGTDPRVMSSLISRNSTFAGAGVYTDMETFFERYSDIGKTLSLSLRLQFPVLAGANGSTHLRLVGSAGVEAAWYQHNAEAIHRTWQTIRSISQNPDFPEETRQSMDHDVVTGRLSQAMRSLALIGSIGLEVAPFATDNSFWQPFFISARVNGTYRPRADTGGLTLGVGYTF